MLRQPPLQPELYWAQEVAEEVPEVSEEDSAAVSGVVSAEDSVEAAPAEVAPPADGRSGKITSRLPAVSIPS